VTPCTATWGRHHCALDTGPHTLHLTGQRVGGWGWTDHTPGAVPHREPDDLTLFDHLEHSA